MASLRIAITTSEEPIVVNGFIRAIIEARQSQIICLVVIERRASYARVFALRKKQEHGRKPDGDERRRSSTGAAQRSPSTGRIARLRQNIEGLLSVLLIYGVGPTLVQAMRLSAFKVREFMHALRLGVRSRSIRATATSLGIPVLTAQSINDPELAGRLRDLRPDVIINQAPGILREEFLAIPRIGVLNRHNSLLPRHRGRLSTFWAIDQGDQRTGVSVHFVTKAVDAGPIIAQREIEIGPHESVSHLAERCYALAPEVMLDALGRLEHGATDFLENADAQATYNTNPTLLEAFRFRMRRIFRIF